MDNQALRNRDSFLLVWRRRLVASAETLRLSARILPRVDAAPVAQRVSFLPWQARWSPCLGFVSPPH